MDHEKPSQARFEDTMMSDHEKEDSSTRYANSEAGIAHVEGNRKMEKKILRRLDAVILPLTALLYLSVSFLWRSFHKGDIIDAYY
jgi:hypothetical protein